MCVDNQRDKAAMPAMRSAPSFTGLPMESRNPIALARMAPPSALVPGILEMPAMIGPPMASDQFSIVVSAMERQMATDRSTSSPMIAPYAMS